MYYKDDDEDGCGHNYSPNELARLSVTNKDLHDKIINANLNEGDTIEDWQQRNLEHAQECLHRQRCND